MQKIQRNGANVYKKLTANGGNKKFVELYIFLCYDEDILNIGVDINVIITMRNKLRRV